MSSSPSSSQEERRQQRPNLARRRRRRRRVAEADVPRSYSSPESGCLLNKQNHIMMLAVAPLFYAAFVPHVSAHGYLKTPRSRNIVAYQDKNWATFYSGYGASNDPEPEDCPHCLNRGGSLAQCGILFGLSENGPFERNYDQPLNSRGLPMPPNIQGIYQEGDVIEIEVLATTHHRGHFEFAVCPLEETTPMPIPTEECFSSNKLAFLSDELYGSPQDPNYPERAYLAPASVASWTNGAPGEQPVVGAEYKMKFQLPRGVSGDLVLLQWYYLTANSCKHPGYDEYPFPKDWGKDVEFYPRLPDCEDIPEDGNGVPEQFWNCAEIKVVSTGGSSDGQHDTSGFSTVTRPTRPNGDASGTAVDASPTVPAVAGKELVPEPLPTPPTKMPTQNPTTLRPTGRPTQHPTRQTQRPTGQPTSQPTRQTQRPTIPPTPLPTHQTLRPSARPTSQPARRTPRPTKQPTPRPTRHPTRQPTPRLATREPTNRPVASTVGLHKKEPWPTPNAVVDAPVQPRPTVQSEPSVLAFFQNAKPTRRPQRRRTLKPTKRPSPSFTMLSPSEPYVVPVDNPTKGQEPLLGDKISSQIMKAEKPMRQGLKEQKRQKKRDKKKKRQEKRQKRNQAKKSN